MNLIHFVFIILNSSLNIQRKYCRETKQRSVRDETWNTCERTWFTNERMDLDTIIFEKPIGEKESEQWVFENWVRDSLSSLSSESSSPFLLNIIFLMNKEQFWPQSFPKSDLKVCCGWLGLTWTANIKRCFCRDCSTLYFSSRAVLLLKKIGGA